MKKYSVDAKNDGVEDELYGVPPDKIEKMVAKGFSRTALLARIKRIHDSLGYVTDSLLRIGNGKIEVVLSEMVARRESFDEAQTGAIREMERMGVIYNGLPKDYQEHYRPLRLLPKVRFIYSRLGRVPHYLLRYNEFELPPIIDGILEKENIQKVTRQKAIDELTRYGVVFDTLPPSLRVEKSSVGLLEKARIVFEFTGRKPSNKDLSLTVNELIDKMKRQLTRGLDSENVPINMPARPETIRDGSRLYILCLPHQSREFSRLHGTEVEVIFKGATTRRNTRFDPKIVAQFEGCSGVTFIPKNYLMVALATDPTAKPFIIPRSMLVQNKPHSRGEIERAKELFVPRPNDPVKFVSGGAKQMAHEPPETREIRKKIPRAILLTPEDDRYALAMHFVRYEFQSHVYGAQRLNDLSKVVCWLPDFQQDGEPVVWIVDEKKFLSDSPNVATASTRESVDTVLGDGQLHKGQDEGAAVMKETPNMSIRRRLPFNLALPKDIKSLFSEDDLWFDGVMIPSTEMGTSVHLDDRSLDLIRRGVVVIFYIPQKNKYVCIERKFLTIIPC